MRNTADTLHLQRTISDALTHGRTIRITCSNRTALFLVQRAGYVRVTQGGVSTCSSVQDFLSQLSTLRRAGYLTASRVAVL